MVKPEKKLKRILLIAGITGAVWAGFRYLLPLVIPFLLAWATALWLRPSIRFFERRLSFSIGERRFSLPAGVIGGLELAVLLAGISWLLYRVGKLALSQLWLVSARLPGWLSSIEESLGGFLAKAENAFGLPAGALTDFAGEMMAQLEEMARQSTMPLLMDNSMVVVKFAAGVLIFLVIYFVAVILTAQEMEELRERRSRSVFRREFLLIGRRLSTVTNAWIRTQFVIMAITSMLCMLGLTVIGNPYSVLLGAGIGLLDALPLFGTGTVLIPWGILLLMGRRWGQAAVILGLYLLCYFARQMMEAKIMGGKMGLSPLETLASMYVGLELFGIAGFLLGPVGLLMIGDLTALYGEDSG